MAVRRLPGRMVFEEWGAHRVEEVMARNQPDRVARIRDEAPSVLAAEMDRWR